MFTTTQIRTTGPAVAALLLSHAMITSPVFGAGAPPATIELTGVVRDFKPSGVPGGHPDFDKYLGGPNHMLIKPALGADSKPQFLSTKGKETTSDYRDSAGRVISPTLYSAALGDSAGGLKNGDIAITSAASFASCSTTFKASTCRRR